MIDHLTLTVTDLAVASAFYSQALAPLGYSKQRDYGVIQGFGTTGKPAFWLKQGPAPQSAMHIAFHSRDRGCVDGFHDAAIKAGAKDDGVPGVRENYHANYYAAFVIDPDGHHVEAVCHLPMGGEDTVVTRAPRLPGKVAARKVTKKKPAAKAKAKRKTRK